MIVIFFAVGLFAGMIRTAGWVAAPFAAILPIVLWVSGVGFADSGIAWVLTSSLLWAGATIAGLVLSLCAQQMVTNDWMKAQSPQR